MTKSMKHQIEVMAKHCVIEMGDIFWDRDAYPGADAEYADPFETAKDCVAKTLSEFARRHVLKDRGSG